MTAEENLDELLKLTEGKKEKVKNVNCCIILQDLSFIEIYILIFYILIYINNYNT